jgi:hypothetical protein
MTTGVELWRVPNVVMVERKNFRLHVWGRVVIIGGFARDGPVPVVIMKQMVAQIPVVVSIHVWPLVVDIPQFARGAVVGNFAHFLDNGG